MRGGDGGHERDVADGERADAVRGGDAQPGLPGDLGARLAEEPLGLGVRLVVERGDGCPVVVVADDALERDEGAVLRVCTNASIAARSSGSA